MEPSGFDNPISHAVVPTGEGTVLHHRFKLLQYLGAGTVGCVYRAYDSNRREEIAIKIFYPNLIRESEVHQKLKETARLNSRLQHPCVLNVYDVIESNDRIYCTMELLKGRCLKHLIRERFAAGEPFSIDEILPWFEKLIETLQSVEETTPHLGLKPDNVFIGSDGSVKIMDFGYSLCLGRNTRSLTCLLASSVSYQAPELILGETSVDARADQFSLAAIIHELLTGLPPVGIPKAIHHTRPEIPTRFSKAVARGLNADPPQRFIDYTQMAESLQSSQYPPVLTPSMLKQGAAVLSGWIAVMLLILLMFPNSSVSTWMGDHLGLAKPISENQWQAEDAVNRIMGLHRSLLAFIDEIDKKSDRLKSELNAVDDSDPDIALTQFRLEICDSMKSRIGSLVYSPAKRGQTENLLGHLRRQLQKKQFVRILEKSEWALRSLQLHFEEAWNLRKLEKQLNDTALGLHSSSMAASIPDEILSSIQEAQSELERLATALGDSETFSCCDGLVMELEILRNNTLTETHRFRDLAEKSGRAWKTMLASNAVPSVLHLGNPDRSFADGQQALTQNQWLEATLLFQNCERLWSAWTEELKLAGRPDESIPTWGNSLGMVFVPVQENLKMSIYETRVMDYAAFIRHSGFDGENKWRHRDFNFDQSGSTHPVLYVTWRDALAFCEWLTRFEREQGWISSHHTYRMTLSEEWMQAGGFKDALPDYDSMQDKS